MPHEATLKRIGAVIRRSLSDLPNLPDAGPFQESTPLDALGLDSLTVLDLVYDLQQEFKCEGDMRDLTGLRTLGDLAVYLEAREGSDS